MTDGLLREKKKDQFHQSLPTWAKPVSFTFTHHWKFTG